MSEEKNKTTLNLSDDAIVMLRELIQLSILTGTNVIDHFRALQLEVDAQNKLVPTEEYVSAYNTMVDDLSEKARLVAEAQANEAFEKAKSLAEADKNTSSPGFTVKNPEHDDNLN